VDGDPTYRCEPGNAEAFEGEAVGPSITPMMKKPGDLSRLRINSRQVRTLVKIAAVASEREIVRIIASFATMCST